MLIGFVYDNDKAAAYYLGGVVSSGIFKSWYKLQTRHGTMVRISPRTGPGIGPAGVTRHWTGVAAKIAGMAYGTPVTLSYHKQRMETEFVSCREPSSPRHVKLSSLRTCVSAAKSFHQLPR